MKPEKFVSKENISEENPSESNPKAQNKRKHVRFKPGPLDIAFVQFPAKDSKYFTPEFKPDCVAFIEELAPLGGTGLILHNRPELQKGNICRIQLGPLAPLLAEIVYLRVLKDDLLCVGCHFLE
jgi:hypothetical protein